MGELNKIENNEVVTKTKKKKNNPINNSETKTIDVNSMNEVEKQNDDVIMGQVIDKNETVSEIKSEKNNVTMPNRENDVQNNTCNDKYSFGYYWNGQIIYK